MVDDGIAMILLHNGARVSFGRSFDDCDDTRRRHTLGEEKNRYHV